MKSHPSRWYIVKVRRVKVVRDVRVRMAFARFRMPIACWYRRDNGDDVEELG